MEFINSYVAHLVEQGILSKENQSCEEFLNKLLYSDQIEITDFDQRSVICLQQYFQQLNEDEIHGVSQKIFESWQKKQNDVIHQKLSKLFQSAELKNLTKLKLIIQKWNRNAALQKMTLTNDQLKAKLDKIQQELNMEKEEKEQYLKILDMTSNSLKESFSTNQMMVNVPSSNKCQTPMILEYSMSPKQNPNTQYFQNHFSKVNQVAIDQDNTNYTQYQPLYQTQEYDQCLSNQNVPLIQSYNYSNGSKTEFDPMNSVTHRHTKSLAQTAFGELPQNQLQHENPTQKYVSSQDLIISGIDQREQIYDQNSNTQKHHQHTDSQMSNHFQPQKQIQQQQPQSGRLSNERIITPESDYEEDFNECNNIQNKMSSPQQLISELHKQSKEDRMRFILEKVIQEKFQGKVPDHLTVTQQRELEHLVTFVNKINDEAAECTFHPQINPKTKRIVDKMMNSKQCQQIFDRLYKEGEMKNFNHTRYKEIKAANEMIECTFSPKTNSPSITYEKTFSPQFSINRLHYKEVHERNEKLSRKEAEKHEQFKKDYTFKPERPKTKKLDNFLVKSNKENQEDDLYERLYRNHMEKEEKLEMKRMAIAQVEIDMINNGPLRSKSGKRDKQLEMQNIINQYQLYPQTATNSRVHNREQTILSPTNAFNSNKKYLPHYSSTISFQSNLRHGEHSQTKNKLALNSSNNFGTLSHSSIQSPSNNSAFNRLYQNAQLSSKRKEKLKKIIDEELGISFSPKMFKAANRVAQPSPKTNVIDRNEEFLRNKIMKIQLKEEQKYSDCTFEPSLIAKNKKQQSKVMQSINMHKQKLNLGNSRCDISEYDMSDARFSYSNGKKQSLINVTQSFKDLTLRERVNYNEMSQSDMKKQRVTIEQKLKQQYLKNRNKDI